MAWREDPARCRLAEEAARRAATGLEAGPVLAGLRRLTIAGLLTAGPAPRRRPPGAVGRRKTQNRTVPAMQRIRSFL